MFLNHPVLVGPGIATECFGNPGGTCPSSVCRTSASSVVQPFTLPRLLKKRELAESRDEGFHFRAGHRTKFFRLRGLRSLVDYAQIVDDLVITRTLAMPKCNVRPLPC